MDVQEIEVIIEKDGTVRVEVRGVKGKSCLDLTQGLEEALGGIVLDREMRPEFLENPVEDQNQLWIKGIE